MQNYNAGAIQVLEGLEPVRTRPGMYIGNTGSRGYNHLLYEIIDNAVDEHLAGYCTEIHITLNKDGSATVLDNGRGIPVDMHKKGMSAERVIMMTLHAGGKFGNENYKTAGGLHGVGSSVVNALSEKMSVTVFRDKKIYRDTYSRGKPTTELEKGLLPVIGKTDKTGTEITFSPDEEVFGKLSFREDLIKTRIHETAYLNPNLYIYYEDKRENKEETITFHEPGGIDAYVTALSENKETLTPVIHFAGTDNNISIEGSFIFVNEFEENVYGFCNNILTQEGGTHLTGFKTRFTQLINTYARELGLLKEKDDNYTGPDTRTGMICVLSIKHPNPLFEGQTKTKLGSSDATTAVSNVTRKELQIYFDKNIETVKNIIACAEKSAKIRKNEERTKANLLTKQKYSFDSNGKLKNCICKIPEKCEIFIVEGDSAGGSAGTARNRDYQAIFPIRGKILNVEKASINKVLENAEIKSMINAFGCGFSEGYGNNFDITKLRYDKIILMTDADVDGSHIDTLLMTFFFRFMPELITSGHVFIAMPPLYKVTPQRGATEFLYDDRALEKYKKTHKNFELKRYKGLGEMDPSELWETTLDPKTRLLKKIEIENLTEADNTTNLFMGSLVEPRKQYIQKHAADAVIDD